MFYRVSPCRPTVFSVQWLLWLIWKITFELSLWFCTLWLKSSFIWTCPLMDLWVKPTQENEMAVIEFFELWLFEIINKSLKIFKEFTVKSQFTVCHSPFMQTNEGSLCVQRFKKFHVLQSFYEAVVSHWICYRLWCAPWFLSFVGCCIETGLSALVKLLFTPMCRTLPWPLLHFQCPEKKMSLWTLTPPWSTSTLHQEAKHMPEQLTPALPSI